MGRLTRILTIVALAWIGPLGHANAAQDYTIDASHSSVGFSIRHIVSRTTGRFNDFNGSITYDAENPANSSVTATISMASLDTDNARRDGHVKSADFFDVEKYPQITFKSTSAEQKGEMILVTGDLTMHGKTKSIKMPVEILGLGKHPRRGTPLGGFETELRLLCSDYGVNSYENFASVLGDEVKVTITIEAGKPRERRRQAQPAAK